MNPPTEVHLDLALQIAEALARSGNVAAAELIAASEARATTELRGALALGQENCDEVYDELRADCDELRADVVRLTARAERAEAELAKERARLDYLGLHMGTALVAHALDCDYSRCFPIRDAIDLAMKNESNP